jgi:hypothetical protein
MTLVWLPLVPPSSAPANGSAVGDVLALAPCAKGDPSQAFQLTASNTVVHAASGLCVAQADGGGSNALMLAPCTPGDAAQTWVVTSGGAVTNGQTGAGCVSFNNANDVIVDGNPVLFWPCDQPPAWNEVWTLPQVGGQAGALVAHAQDGSTSSLCAAAVPAVAPGQWTLPWLDAWSLKDY